MISLGINYSEMHDSAACIARDGHILFAVAEERLSRLKHDARFPSLSIEACLAAAGVRADQLDFVCFGWPPAIEALKHDLKCMATGSLPLNYVDLVSTVRRNLNHTRKQNGKKQFLARFPTKAQFRFVEHHLAHAISAYSFSGFDDAAVLVLDGRGAWEASSLWHGRDGRLEHVWTIPWPNSLGLFYAQFTQYLGFQPYSDEWKVMGLAPYGEPGVNLRDFIIPDDNPYKVSTRLLLDDKPAPLAGITARLGPPREAESEIDPKHKNLAFAVQDACEEAMMTLARAAVAKTGSRNICLAGGVALNSKANGKILSSGIVDRIFVQPAAGDDGVCLGAALAPYLDNGGKLPMHKMRHAYLGAENSDEEIEKALTTYKLRATRVADPAAAAADMLANGKILGWVQGRMEFGPRALGARSILADPRDPEMNAKVNNAVKFREWWRPFAPSMLAEVADEYIESATDSPFMILTAQVKPEKRSVIPSVTHVDGSARPQTVERDVNPLYWRLIREFGNRTGVPVVMNTSFNLRGEPIVSTPTDAVRTFFSSGMDALVIGNFVVEK
ncbi:MAG TPA: carbamoyltransferase [Candidatus Dormibacteraeota bacterium]|nr:carbamoyltransferase [Candidatus Dormibacteraeota bacterium]